MKRAGRGREEEYNGSASTSNGLHIVGCASITFEHLSGPRSTHCFDAPGTSSSQLNLFPSIAKYPQAMAEGRGREEKPQPRCAITLHPAPCTLHPALCRYPRSWVARPNSLRSGLYISDFDTSDKLTVEVLRAPQEDDAEELTRLVVTSTIVPGFQQVISGKNICCA